MRRDLSLLLDTAVTYAQLETLAFRRDEDLRLPPELDYAAIGGLSNEVRGKLAADMRETADELSRALGGSATPLGRMINS